MINNKAFILIRFRIKSLFIVFDEIFSCFRSKIFPFFSFVKQVVGSWFFILGIYFLLDSSQDSLTAIVAVLTNFFKSSQSYSSVSSLGYCPVLKSTVVQPRNFWKCPHVFVQSSYIIIKFNFPFKGKGSSNHRWPTSMFKGGYSKSSSRHCVRKVIFLSSQTESSTKKPFSLSSGLWRTLIKL